MSLNSILKFIYPDKCPYCGAIINDDKESCDKCIKGLKRFNDVRVIDALDDACNINKKIICFSPFTYESKVRNAICRFKFNGYKQYANQFSKAMFDEISKRNNGEMFDIVTNVPMSKNRKKVIGYNQTKILAKHLSKRLNISYKDLIVKIKENEIQHKLSAQERKKNVMGVYAVKKEDDVKGKRILVCDDIVTTGSTLREICLVLIKAGALSVNCVTIANSVLD